MKTLERIADRSRVAEGGRRLTHIGGALVLASSMLIAGNADSGQDGPPPSPLSASTEGIGSLPSVIAPDPDLPYDDPYGLPLDPYDGLIPPRLDGPEGLLRPFVVLGGSATDLDLLVLGASGNGVISLVPGPYGNGFWTAGFHGDVRIKIDPAEAEGSPVEVGIRVGTEFEGGLGMLSVDGAFTPAFKLSDTTLSIALNKLLQLGFLNEDGVEAYFVSPFGTKAHVTIQMQDGRLVISQEIF